MLSESTPLLVSQLQNKEQQRCSWRIPFLITTLLFVTYLAPRPANRPLPLLMSPENETACTKVPEVWLIRHGEKNTNERSMDAMYNLSDTGWQRAYYLAALVETERWPHFGAIFASAYASETQMREAWPEVATYKGQSLIKREYQTVLPLAKLLGVEVNTMFYKNQVHEVALAATRAAMETCEPVLISWDHCSLPTLVFRGFQCVDTECQRCWPDDQCDLVMKLEVSVKKEKKDIWSLSTSRLRQMSREYFHAKATSTSQRVSGTNQDLPSQDQLEVLVDARISTPCSPSYCSDRPEAAQMVHCLCFDDINHVWAPLIAQ